ncbi:MAG: DUF4249 family protein [Ignavibacteriaceae bacterium]|nr:DUF4249 family protein [Ignavibacteriaceae bacterium]
MRNTQSLIQLRLFPFLLLIVAGFFFAGCEQAVEEEEFPYETKLVIRGLLEDGQDIKEIFIGRTLPVAVPFRADFSNLPDAVVSIRVDSLRYILKHTKDGLYNAPAGVKARAGKTYELLVSWGGYSAGAITKIPDVGSVGGVFMVNSVNDTGKAIRVMSIEVTPRADEAYAATWLAFTQSGQIYTEDTKYNTVVRKLPGAAANTLQILSAEVPASYASKPQDLGAGIYVYDTSFYDYFKTKGSSKLSDAVFGQPSTSVKWNILGDGIGMFIGRSKTVKAISSSQ